MRLRTPGQRLPSQSRLITYRIACKSQMVDNEEPTVILMCASAIIEVLKYGGRQIELSEGEVGQRLGALRLSPVGEREADNREETLHGHRSGWNAEVLPSHASWVGEVLDVICPQFDTIPARRSDIRYATLVRRLPRDRGDTLGLGRYTRINMAVGASLPISSEYQHVHAWRRRRRPQSGVPCRGDFLGT